MTDFLPKEHRSLYWIRKCVHREISCERVPMDTFPKQIHNSDMFSATESGVYFVRYVSYMVDTLIRDLHILIL